MNFSEIQPNGKKWKDIKIKNLQSSTLDSHFLFLSLSRARVLLLKTCKKRFSSVYSDLCCAFKWLFRNDYLLPLIYWHWLGLNASFRLVIHKFKKFICRILDLLLLFHLPFSSIFMRFSLVAFISVLLLGGLMLIKRAVLLYSIIHFSLHFSIKHIHSFFTIDPHLFQLVYWKFSFTALIGIFFFFFFFHWMNQKDKSFLKKLRHLWNFFKNLIEKSDFLWFVTIFSSLFWEKNWNISTVHYLCSAASHWNKVHIIINHQTN